MRGSLTVLDRAVYVAEWRSIYLQGHQLPKRGNSGSKAPKAANDDTEDRFALSLVEATKRALDLSKNALYRALKIAAVGRPIRQRLAGHWLADNQAQLLRLAEQDEDRQAAIVDLILADRAGSVADAIAILDKVPPLRERTSAERAFQTIARLSDEDAFEVYALDAERIERWRESKRPPPRPKLRRVK